MVLNQLKLNDDKTEFIILGSPHMLKKVETVSIIVGEHVVQASKCVRNIGAFFDTEVTRGALKRSKCDCNK